MGVLLRDTRDIKYAGGVSPNLSHWVVGVFHSISRMEPSFPIGYLKDNIREHSLYFFP
jgi:hypothetical protein